MATRLVAANKEADRQMERLTGRQKNMKENKEKQQQLNYVKSCLCKRSILRKFTKTVFYLLLITNHLTFNILCCHFVIIQRIHKNSNSMWKLMRANTHGQNPQHLQQLQTVQHLLIQSKIFCHAIGSPRKGRVRSPDGIPPFSEHNQKRCCIPF